jgi:predicted MFS family arabinose efflux permease
MGIWGGLAGLGGTLGVVAGGVLVDAIGWQGVFFVNVPIGIAVIAATPLLVRESRAGIDGPRGLNATGAVLGTGGLLTLVLGVIRAEPLGWGATEVVALLAGAVVLFAAFFVVESRSAAPLVPLRLFRTRGLQTASLGLALNGAAFLAMFFLTAIFLQQVRADSALDAGLHFLPMGFAAIAGAAGASTLVTRLGTRPVHIGGALMSVAGLVLLARVNAASSYTADILPGLLLFGVGIMGVGVANQITAVADVRHEEAGAASGVVSAAYQVGGALGLAIITTLSTSRTAHALAGGAAQSDALVQGFQRGLLIAAVFAAINIAVALPSPQLRPSTEQLGEAATAA